MDTEAYLLARQQIQDRLEARRLQLFRDSAGNGASAASAAWWPVVGSFLVRNAGWHKVFSGIVTAGAGYALSRLATRFGLKRYVSL